MASRPREQSAARSVSAIADHVIRRITGMARRYPHTPSERRATVEPRIGLLELRGELQQHVVVTGTAHDVSAHRQPRLVHEQRERHGRLAGAVGERSERAVRQHVFEAVLDVLKKDYGVRVVKKPLGKSSRSGSSKG